MPVVPSDAMPGVMKVAGLPLRSKPWSVSVALVVLKRRRETLLSLKNVRLSSAKLSPMR